MKCESSIVLSSFRTKISVLPAMRLMILMHASVYHIVHPAGFCASSRAE